MVMLSVSSGASKGSTREDVQNDRRAVAIGVIGAFGGGVDYFLTSDIALGLEAKYVISRAHTLQINDGPRIEGNLDALFVSLGVRAFLFDL